MSTKQRGEYIKLVIKTEKDAVKVEQTKNGDGNQEYIPVVSRANSMVVDFPLHDKRMAIQVVHALEYAVSLCARTEALQP